VAITVTQRGAINSSADDASIDIENVVLTVDRIYLALFYTSKAGGAPKADSISGTGIDFEEISLTGSGALDIDGGNVRLGAWVGKCTASGTVTITVALNDVSENSDVAIYELGGVDNKLTSSAYLQAVCLTSNGTPGTAVGPSLSAFADPRNRPLAFAMHRANEATGHDSGDGYTELLDAAHSSPNSGFAVQWHDTSPNTSPNFTWSTSSEYGAIAFELVVAPDPIQVLLPTSPHRKRVPPPPPRRRELRFAEWFPFPAAQSIGVVSFGQLSREVELVEGDEIRITLSGPAADQPQVRLTLGGKQIH
jgi:hypothetical protein